MLPLIANWLRQAQRNHPECAAEYIGDTVLSVGPDGKHRYMSPTASRIFGASPATVAVRGLAGFLHPDDRPAEAAMRAALLNGLQLEQSLTYRVLHASRGVVWVESRARRCMNPDSGAPDGFIALLRDVTARRAIEDMHGEAEAQYRLLAENTSDAVTCMDLELTHTYASPTFGKMFGYRQDEVVGEPRSRIVHPDDLAEVYRHLGRLSAGGSDHELVTYRLRHQQGHFVWVESHFSLVREAGSGRPLSISCSVRDVTERRAQADALQAANAALQGAAIKLAAARDRAELASRAKSRFLANVSHELRTPLNGILGYAEILRQDNGVSPPHAALVGEIWTAGQHLLDTINSVLNLAEIEAEKLDLHLAPLDLRNLIDGCVALVRPRSEAQGLTLDVSLAPDLPAHIVADQTRLRRITINLLGNAVKFTTEGGVSLRLLQSDTAMLRLEVADTGPGVPLAQRDRLFREFERLDAGADGTEGTGLGLALTAQLVSLMHGQVGYSENPGGGSIFWCELPLQAASDCPAPSRQPDTVACLPLPLRILVVDDVAINRDVATLFLRNAGHAVELATDGALGTAMAAAADYDAILMDVRMPAMDGLEATRRIRALPGQRGRVPIVALTAQAFAEQVRLCRAAGMDSHLAKPFSQCALMAAICQAIGRAGQRDNRCATPAAGMAAAHRQCADRDGAASQPQASAATSVAVFDRDIFGNTAAFLEQPQIDSHLRTIIANSEALLENLRSPAVFSGNVDELVAAAHSLAGSTSMLGFMRAYEAARQFELCAGSANARDAAARLARDLEATLPVLRATIGVGSAAAAAVLE